MTASTIAQLVRAFNEARRDIGGSQAHIADDILDRLEHEAFSVLYAENDRGGEARGIVAQVATAAGVDIDEGTGHRWDRDHMARVVPAVKALKSSLGDALELVSTLSDERDSYKRAYEAKPASMFLESPGADKVLDTMFRETTVAYRANRARLEEAARENDDLRDTIVSQAREIARLKETRK